MKKFFLLVSFFFVFALYSNASSSPITNDKECSECRNATSGESISLAVVKCCGVSTDEGKTWKDSESQISIFKSFCKHNNLIAFNFVIDGEKISFPYGSLSDFYWVSSENKYYSVSLENGDNYIVFDEYRNSNSNYDKAEPLAAAFLLLYDCLLKESKKKYIVFYNGKKFYRILKNDYPKLLDTLAHEIFTYTEVRMFFKPKLTDTGLDYLLF